MGTPSDPEITRRTYLKSLAAMAAATSTFDVHALTAKPTQVHMIVFRPPSLGAFLSIIVNEKGFDIKNGVSIQLDYTTPDNYNTEFAAGHYELGGSAALLSEGLRNAKGVRTTFLFNLFDFWGAVVTHKTGVPSLAGLAGHSLAAATGTTNYAMFTWFAKNAGLDVNSLKLLNATPGGLVAMAVRDRADFVELWEPAYTALIATDPSIKTINLDFKQWKNKFNVQSIPYLGVAALTEWAEKNPGVVKQLYASYKDAADWVAANPQDASELLAKKIPSAKVKDLMNLIIANDRLGMNVQYAGDIKSEIDAVMKAGLEIGYFDSMPPETIIYKS